MWMLTLWKNIQSYNYWQWLRRSIFIILVHKNRDTYLEISDSGSQIKVENSTSGTLTNEDSHAFKVKVMHMFPGVQSKKSTHWHNQKFKKKTVFSSFWPQCALSSAHNHSSRNLCSCTCAHEFPPQSGIHLCWESIYNSPQHWGHVCRSRFFHQQGPH